MYEEGTLNKKLIIVGSVLVILLIIGIIVFFATREKPITKEFDAARIVVGEKYQVEMDHIKKDKSDLEFLTSNEEIATINKSGIVRGRSVGRVTIIIRDNKYDYVTQDIIVEENDGTKILFKEATLELEKDEIIDLKEEIDDINEIEGTLLYETSDEEIIEVDEEGIVTALKAGEAEITVKTEDEAKEGKITVTVLKEEPKENTKKNDKSSKKTNSNSSNRSSTSSKESSSSKTSSSVNPKSISLNTTSKVLYTNYPKASSNTFKLTATVSPSNAKNKTVSYSSSNTKVASVSSNGTVTAKSPGTAYITAKTKNGVSKKATVIVRATTKSISFSVYPTTLKATGTSTTNKTATLTASFSPSNTYFKTVNWKSSNTSVASVSKRTSNTATLTLKKPGRTRVTATTSGNPTVRTFYRDLVVNGLFVKVWKTGGGIYDRTRSSISFDYNSNYKVHYNLSLYPSSSSIRRSNLTVSSSNSKVLSCPSGYSYCNMVGRGTAYLYFKYKPDTTYSSYVRVTLT